MTERITIEDQNKLIVARDTIGRLQQKIVRYALISEEKNILSGRLESFLDSTALTLKNIKELEREIDSIMDNENFEDDELTLRFRHFRNHIRDFIFLNGRQFKMLSDSYLKLLDFANDIKQNPITKTVFLDADETKMSEGEKKEVSDKAEKLIMYYKEFRNAKKVAESNAILMQLNIIADTGEKMHVIDEIAFEKTGDYILKRYRTAERKQENKEEDKEQAQEVGPNRN